MADGLDFFREKKPWSRYKDLILRYYLKPYLQKIRFLRKPILAMDCFAGPGRFEDNEPGSPLIIAESLQEAAKTGYPVSALFIEANKTLYEKLSSAIEGFTFPIDVRLGSFHDYAQELVSLAKESSVFVYLDPFKPSDLHFEDMRHVYEKLYEGQSVEVLINFMSWGFVRGALGIKASVMQGNTLLADHPYVQEFDRIAGGTYWRDIVFDKSLLPRQRTDKLTDAYAAGLRQWFRFVLTYPIRDKYATKYPKYHMVFGSRSYDAVDLMNRAMVKARGEFIANQFIRDHLFPNQPEGEVFDPQQVKHMIVETCRRIGKAQWRHLRACATVAAPGLYTDSQFNQAIKKAIQDGDLRSDCPGTKIQNEAWVWPP